LFIDTQPSLKSRLKLADLLFRTKNKASARKLLVPVLNGKLIDDYVHSIAHIFDYSVADLDINGDVFMFFSHITSKKMSVKQLSVVCKLIRRADLELSSKLALIEDLRVDDSPKVNGIERKVILDLLNFELILDQHEIVDVRCFLTAPPYSSETAKAYMLFLPYIIRQGYDEVAVELINSLPRTTKMETEYYVGMLIRNYPALISPSDVTLPDEATKLAIFANVIYHLRSLDPAWVNLFEESIAQLTSFFPYLDLIQKNDLIGQLVQIGRLSTARQLLMKTSDFSILSSEKLLLGHEHYEAGRFADSFDAFLEVLSENPSNGNATDGMRSSGLRSRTANEEIFCLENQLLDRSEKISGRSSTVSEIRSSILSHRSNGRHLEATRERLKTPLYRTLLNYFGARLLTDQDFIDLNYKSSIFIFDHFGVGDFIRVTQVLGQLVGHFEKVIVACDPRLVNILSNSFPHIQIIPSPALRKGATDTVLKMQDRMSGFNGVLKNYLTQDAGQAMLTADFIVSRVYMEYLVCEPFSHSSRPKGAYYFPKYNSPRPLPFDGSRPLRVGLLWRSNLLSGRRKSMYVAIEDFLKILDLDGIEFHSVQHRMTESERAYCLSKGVIVHDDIDLYDDFDGMSDLLSSLDVVIGISSVPAELAAALGVKVWFLGFSPENFVLRTSGGRTEIDQLTANAINFTAPDIDFSEPVEICIEKVMDETRRRLSQLLVRKGAFFEGERKI
jgi:DNA-binding transcriptional ArsR family regulator